MNNYLNITPSQLNENNGYWTAKEICQQPDTWGKVADIVQGQKSDIDAWLAPILAKKELRIILTGAGTSAYVGETIAPSLTQTMGRPIEAISTTDLVGNPQQYLLKNVPTLLISYARSGNSPESVAALKIASQLVNDCFHLIITCNENGELALLSKSSGSFCLLMPKETLDQSFAMTSSFTSMMISTLLILSPDHEQLNRAITATRYLLTNHLDDIYNQAQIPFNRIAFLGSGSLNGIATEAALKMLELTAGEIDCHAETPLGFRHGPKSMVNEQTMLILLESNHPYSKKYDRDLAAELVKDQKTLHIYTLNIEKLFNKIQLEDVWLSLPYMVYCQILSFYKSLALNITPDNPCPSGEVNRVVQGVTIHTFED